MREHEALEEDARDGADGNGQQDAKEAKELTEGQEGEDQSDRVQTGLAAQDQRVAGGLDDFGGRDDEAQGQQQAASTLRL